MKKNVMMRIASVLLICVLVSTCGISGTFAKYVTKGEASDTARVAKWGVEVFNNNGTAFAKEYKDSATKMDVVVKSDDFVVAPGTNSDEVGGNLIFGVTGTPEVKTEITVNFDGTDIYYGSYHPIRFTLWVVDTNNVIADAENIKHDDPVWNTAHKTENLTFEGLKTALATYANFNQDAGVTLDALYKITWSWDFDDNGAGTNDFYDTKLGDLMANMTGSNYSGDDSGTGYNLKLSYGVEITVEQVD